MHLHVHVIWSYPSLCKFTPGPQWGIFNPAIGKIYPVRHLPPRGAYEVFRFSNLPPRYLWGLSKPRLVHTARVRPNTPWLNEDIKQAKSEKRRRERKWQSTRLYARCLPRQRPLSTMTRSQRVVKIVSLSWGSWISFLIGRGQETHLPDIYSTTEIVDAFSNFFNDKVIKIRERLDWPLAHLW